MKIILLSISILLSQLSFGQTPGFKLFLIGDTGDDKKLQSTMLHFLETISSHPNSATVILGDNCYKGFRKGFDSSKLTRSRLGAQLDGLNNSNYRGSVYFVPGNHEWWNVTKNMTKGKRVLKMNQSFIESKLSTNKMILNKDDPFMPKDGNPIASVDLNDNKLKLIFLDTQWLLIQTNETEKENVYSQLKDMLSHAIADSQNIVVAAHHPIYTLGKHSKKRKWQFPRVWKGQDIYHPIYNKMRTRIDDILSKANYPIIYAAGHDHALEYFTKDSVQYIVSGAGSKSKQYKKHHNKKKHHEFKPVCKDELPNKIAKVSEGYFEVEYTGDTPIVNAVLIKLSKQLME
jgi:hypothetical protein